MKVHNYIVLAVCLALLQCSSTSEKNRESVEVSNTEKVNGVSFVAPPKKIGASEVSKPKEKLGANYLSLMPYAFIPENSTDLKYDSKWQWWGETSKGTIEIIRLAKAEGYKIMLKPHVWKRHGEFTGNHKYEEESKWKEFEGSYEAYILHYAKIADSMNVSMFCIGTEWEKFALERKAFWRKLIKKVRKEFSGKLTYAANWDEYEKIYFWEELDFIGIDAYFPLVDSKTPTVSEITRELKEYEKQVNALSDSTNKRILFTEYGYRSRDQSALRPWEADRVGEANMIGQQNAYEGFYQTFWNKKYLAGGFIWKWFSNYEESGGEQHNGFTPQNKPVEKTIARTYSKQLD